MGGRKRAASRAKTAPERAQMRPNPRFRLFSVPDKGLQSLATLLPGCVESAGGALWRAVRAVSARTRRKNGPEMCIGRFSPESAASRCLDGRYRAELGKAAHDDCAADWRGEGGLCAIGLSTTGNRHPERKADGCTLRAAGRRGGGGAQPGHRCGDAHHHGPQWRLPVHRAGGRHLHADRREQPAGTRTGGRYRDRCGPGGAGAGGNRV